MSTTGLPHCPACGYCLFGRQSRRCPECGLTDSEMGHLIRRESAAKADSVDHRRTLVERSLQAAGGACITVGLIRSWSVEVPFDHPYQLDNDWHFAWTLLLTLLSICSCIYLYTRQAAGRSWARSLIYLGAAWLGFSIILSQPW